MNIFLDTEFTDLLNPKLISIGFIAEDQRSLYLEMQNWTQGDCSEFVREVVLPLLGPPKDRMPIIAAAAAIVAWIQGLGEPVTLMCDSSIDLQLLGELLRSAELPKPDAIKDANIFSPSAEGEIIRETLYTSTLRRHHSLDDARALLASWETTRG